MARKRNGRTKAITPVAPEATIETWSDKRVRWSAEWRSILEQEFPDQFARMHHLAYSCANEEYWRRCHLSVKELDEAKELLSKTIKQVRDRIERDSETASPQIPLESWQIGNMVREDISVKYAKLDLEQADQKFWLAGLPSTHLYSMLARHRPHLLQDFGPPVRLDESYTPRERAEKCNVVLVKLLAEAQSLSKSKGRTSIPSEEAKVLIRQHLARHPRATVREIKKATGVSTGAISESAPWKAHDKNDSESARSPKAIRLTKRILESIGQTHDPKKGITTREAAWEYLLEKACTEDEMDRLLDAGPATRKTMIDAVVDQFSDNNLDM